MGCIAWIETIVEVASAQAETVASFILDLGSPGLVTEEGTRSVKLTGYFAPDGRQQLSALRVLCDDLAAMEPELPPARIATRPLQQEDWAHNWRKHFPPLAVGRRLYIVPPWIENVPSDRLAIVIDPGLAFGTGHHVTTQGCLILLERIVASKPITKALDVGTGSGILAIALARLGVAEIWAVDIDPEACRAARENCERNNVDRQVRVAKDLQAVLRHSKRFDLITANLLSSLLIQLAPTLAAALVPAGHVIVSGLLDTDAAVVIEAFAAQNLIEQTRHQGSGIENDVDDSVSQWITLDLARPPR